MTNYATNERFKDNIAMITGSATGLGRGVICMLGKYGVKLALFDINKELLQKTIEDFKTMGIQAKEFAATNITVNYKF